VAEKDEHFEGIRGAYVMQAFLDTHAVHWFVLDDPQR